MNQKLCKICKNKLKGRSDKLFCSSKCKSYYHFKLKEVTKNATFEIDAILHRNRSILLEILGKQKTQLKILRLVLDKKKFNYKYHTHITVNSQQKIFYWLYDLAWMEFSNDEVLLIRRRS